MGKTNSEIRYVERKLRCFDFGQSFMTSSGTYLTVGPKRYSVLAVVLR